MRLASVTDLKTFLEKTDSNHDLLLGLILDAVSSSFEGYTGRYFEIASRTEYFDTGGKIFKVKAFPISSSIATVMVIDDTTQTVNDDYFVWHDKGIFELTTDAVKTDPKDVTITYTGGYSWTTGSGRIDVPNDLMFACLIQSAYVFRNRKNVGTTSVTLPDGSVNLYGNDEFLPQVLTVLDRYRL